MKQALSYGFFLSIYCLSPQILAKEINPKALPENVTALYHADKNCFDLNNTQLPQKIIMDDLGNKTSLYIIPCALGAYNIFSKIFVTRRTEAEELFFADYHTSYGWTGTNLLVNIGYDAKTRRLTSFNKSAGHGWCGSSGIWQWKEFGFQMVTFTAWDSCMNEKAPEDWPVVYQKNK